MKWLARVAFWWEGTIWRWRWNAERRRAARNHAQKSILCQRCSAPLFPTEMPDRTCVHCRTYGDSGPRPLGMS